MDLSDAKSKKEAKKEKKGASHRPNFWIPIVGSRRGSARPRRGGGGVFLDARKFTQACVNAYANCTCLEMTSTDHMTLSDQSETAAQFGEAGC